MMRQSGKNLPFLNPVRTIVVTSVARVYLYSLIHPKLEVGPKLEYTAQHLSHYNKVPHKSKSTVSKITRVPDLIRNPPDSAPPVNYVLLESRL